MRHRSQGHKSKPIHFVIPREYCFILLLSFNWANAAVPRSTFRLGGFSSKSPKHLSNTRAYLFSELLMAKFINSVKKANPRYLLNYLWQRWVCNKCRKPTGHIIIIIIWFAWGVGLWLTLIEPHSFEPISWPLSELIVGRVAIRRKIGQYHWPALKQSTDLLVTGISDASVDLMQYKW